MEFNTDKCRVLRVTRKWNPIIHDYTLHGKVLETLSTGTPPIFFRTILCFVALVYNWYFFQNSRFTEIIRNYITHFNFSHVCLLVKMASKTVTRSITYQVNEMLQEMQWNTLEERRKKDRLVMCYKITNDRTLRTGIDTGKYLKPLAELAVIPITANNQAYEVPFALTDYYKLFYFPRTTREWNVLPNETVNVSSLMAFTNCL